MPAPAADALVRWPEDFGRRFTLFVDTEEEFDWSRPPARDARQVSAVAALPVAHRRLRSMGVEATYMVDHPVVADARAAALISGMLGEGGAAIGAQLHPWVNPPFWDGAGPGGTYPGNLPRSVEAAKIDVLTGAIERALGRQPRAYRAGRYGIGPSTAALLVERGYRLDSSVRARYDYRRDGGPDFRAVGSRAYRTGPDGALVELPLTTVFTGRWRGAGGHWHGLAGRVPHGRGLLARLRLVNRVALTPEDMPAGDVVEAVRIAAGEGLALLNLSFHSPSLVPGHTPYVRDAGDLARFWRWWDVVLDALDAADYRSASVDEVIAAAGRARYRGSRGAGL
ncbi:polysaccharide deacetylase family protein [Sphingomonas bacterium]|uniref:polysaccharide deacetylase family protein n=1 Tax=Sphingomonas bacterium TaxID=1895847 RepID=UPI0020C6BDFD|nr:polysaccharide deacetylase family protein [Sphingomonas bacterium]